MKTLQIKFFSVVTMIALAVGSVTAIATAAPTTAGNHIITVYFTNGNNTNLTLHADPNGVSGPTITVPGNGGYDWTQPVNSISITINLNAGNNTIRIWDTNKAPDIDRMVVQ